MIKRTVRGAIQLIGGLGAGVAIIVILVAWQFSKGPIPLGFLSPYIEQAVNAGNRDFTLKMGGTILTWAGWDRALDIRVLDVRVINPAGTTVGNIPEVSFAISGEALLRGKLAPKSVSLFGPHLKFRRDRDGTIDVGFDNQKSGAGGSVVGMIDQLLRPGPAAQGETYLTDVSIVGGDVRITDQVLRKAWHFPAADVHLVRYDDHVSGELSLLLDADGRQTEVDVIGDYVLASRRLNLNLEFAGVAPAVFASITSDLAPLQALDMPFSGRVTLGLPIDGTVDRLGVAIKGGPGRLNLPDPVKQTLEVAAVELTAGYDSQNGRLDIKNLAVDFQPGARFQLPEAYKHAMPVRGFKFAGGVSGGGDKVRIAKLDLNLDGPTLALEGAVANLASKTQSVDIEVAGNLKNVEVNKVRDIWPAAFGTEAHTWVTTRIANGRVPEVTYKARFAVDRSGNFSVVDLDGRMNVKGAEVNYLLPLPKVHGVDARMEFDESSYTIHVDRGTSEGLSIRGGTIVLTGLDEYDQFADIDLKIDGTLPNKLAYIDRKPLGFASLLGIDPRHAEGRGATRLKLFFIIENALTWDQVQVWARSSLNGVGLRNVVMGRSIRDGDLDLRVDKRGMDVAGTVKFDKIPASLKWRENFQSKQEFRSRYTLRARIDDVAHIRDLGLDMEPFSGNYVTGAVDTGIVFTVLDDVDRRLEVTADITDASLSAPAFGWQKPKGQKGEAAVVLHLAKDIVVYVPKFSIKAKDLDVRGLAKYALDGTGLQRIEFAELSFGRTKMKGALLPKADGGWEAGFHGPSLDMSTMWAEILNDKGDTFNEDQPWLDKLTLAVEFDRVWLDLNSAIRNVSGTFVREADVWQTVLFNSQVADDAALELRIVPDGVGNRRLSMRSDNAGKVLKFLDIYPNMRGGKLDIRGTYDDAAPGQPLAGVIQVQDYRISDAPVLAHLLSIMALTGILDALNGDGLAFSNLEIPFELNRGTFRLTDAKATGTSLGFTASGKVFRHADVIDLEGTVIPAYAINSAFGRIPLLGDLFTGGEKGGGVFAAKYTMTGPMEQPNVSVNPLSALTPGFLRNVFGIFGKADPDAGLMAPEQSPTTAQ
ncbi:MAG: AsmA-like C-terminal domain-containing protein [Magnetovibrio sp.]|nr:AsmA-like C-terminal domain-containing protein [Magnetovibrio sp.]